MVIRADSTGFANVDASDKASDLVEYLALLAQQLAEMRKQDYALLRLERGASVLDVGCGRGEVCLELADLVGPAGHVAGIDLSEAMIAAARETTGASALRVDLRTASAYALPFADGTFDAVRAERVLQHLDEPARALAEMIRVVRPGGRVMVMDPDHGQAGMALDDPRHRRVFAQCVRAHLRRGVNAHSGTRLRALFVRAGLRDIQQVVRPVEVQYPQYVTALMLHQNLGEAVDAGDITRAEAQDFVAELEERHRTGTFLANAIAYSVAGTKP